MDSDALAEALYDVLVLADSLALVERTLVKRRYLLIRWHLLGYLVTLTYLADSEALVKALCDADVLADSDRAGCMHSLMHLCFADSDALVEALCDAEVLADSDALVGCNFVEADVLAGFASTCRCTL